MKVLVEFDDVSCMVSIPENESTFMLHRADAAGATIEQMVDILRAVKQVYRGYEVPDDKLALQFWVDALKNFTPEQVLWGVKQHIERVKYAPSPSEILDICNYRRGKQGERFHEISRCFRETLRGAQNVYASHDLPALTPEQVERSAQGFFTCCYEGRSAFGLADSINDIFYHYERGGNIEHLLKLPDILEKIHKEGYEV